MKISIKDLLVYKNEIADALETYMFRIDLEDVRNCSSNSALLSYVLQTYSHLNTSFEFEELDGITPRLLSPWYILTLEKFCPLHPFFEESKVIIDLQKRIAAGDHPSREECRSAANLAVGCHGKNFKVFPFTKTGVIDPLKGIFAAWKSIINNTWKENSPLHAASWRIDDLYHSICFLSTSQKDDALHQELVNSFYEYLTNTQTH